MEIQSFPDIEITTITDNSNKVMDNSIFVCIKGYRVDGHDYIAEVVKKGAAFIISERKLDISIPYFVVQNSRTILGKLATVFYDYPTNYLKLIGVTGTNGKTTTTFLIEKILKDQQIKTGLIGTMYAKIGESKIDVENTTPNALFLQRLFVNMVAQEVEATVMEVSSHALDEGRIIGCDFDIAIFTNLTQDHIDYHQTMVNYKQSKSLLFSQLGTKMSSDTIKYAILNMDDEVSEYYSRITSANVVTYSIHSETDFIAKNIELNSTHTKFTLIYPNGQCELETPLIGMFNVYNCLGAIAASYCYGIAIEDIIKSIQQAPSISGRFEVVNEGQDFTVIVDYAHTPDSLENVLKTILQFAKNDVYCIVGCGGNRDKTKRPKMARIACDNATYPIFTSDNPRMEEPSQILKDMEEGVQGFNYKVIEDRKEAIQFAINCAKPNDVILIAGKGHETYQIVKKEVLHFDDKEEAILAIKNKIMN